MEIKNLSAPVLKNLLARGILNVTGQIPVSRYDTPEYKLSAHLRGQPISISDASKRFGIYKSTISKWVKKGYINILVDDGYRIMIDLADISYCAEIYKANKGQGRWLFNPDGTPYIKN